MRLQIYSPAFFCPVLWSKVLPTMDHIWRQEAEREMTRRYTTPLLPLKLVNCKVNSSSAEPLTKKLPPANMHTSEARVKSTTMKRAVPTDLRNRPVETRISSPREQTSSRRKQNPRPLSDAKSRDSGIALPAAPKDHSLDDFIHDLNKDLIQRRSSATTVDSTEPASTTGDRSTGNMRDRIARSAAAVEDSLPFHLGFKRKDPGIRFQEHGGVIS